MLVLERRTEHSAGLVGEAAARLQLLSQFEECASALCYRTERVCKMLGLTQGHCEVSPHSK